MAKIASPIPIQDNKFTLTVTDLKYSSEYKYKAFIDGGREELVPDLRTVKENDTGAQRSGIIKLTYGSYAAAEFVVTQERKP